LVKQIAIRDEKANDIETLLIFVYPLAFAAKIYASGDYHRFGLHFHCHSHSESSFPLVFLFIFYLVIFVVIFFWVSMKVKDEEQSAKGFPDAVSLAFNYKSFSGRGKLSRSH